MDVAADVLEQIHWKKTGPERLKDFEMFIKASDLVAQDNVFIVKVKANAVAGAPEIVQPELNQTLEIVGFDPTDGEVQFEYENTDHHLKQTFGINLKKYLAQQPKRIDVNRELVSLKQRTEEEHLDEMGSEGAYILKPNWRDPLPKQYSQILEDVMLDRGKFITQWTLLFRDDAT